MGAFDRGFSLGQSAYQQVLDNRDREARRAMEAERHRGEMERLGLVNDAARREASKQNQLQDIAFQMRDAQQGINRPETNAALDADFEAANQAAARGLQVPAVRGGSNAANEAALTVRAPVDMSSAGYREQMAGLRSQYALASGNMADFDQVVAGERQRKESSSDAEFARAIMTDPNGEAAKQARMFINGQSRRISSKVGKDGFTTFAIVNGDGYDELKLSPADLGKLAVGYNRLQRGDVGGLDIISAVNKDLAAVVREEMKLDMDVGKTNNDVAAKRGALANDAARTAIARQQANRPQWQQFVGADGQPVMVDLNSVRSQGGVAQLPQGVSMPKLPQTLSDREKIGYEKALEQLSQLGPDAPQAQVDAIYTRFGLDPRKFGGTGGMPGWGERPGGVATPAPAAEPATQAQPANGLVTREQRLREAYNAWQRARGPWYLPTPAGNAEARAAEQAYLELLRNPNAR